MKRIDNVANLLKTQKRKMTAIQIADILKIRRNEASSDLNVLYKDGFVTKTNTRPVEFSWIEDTKKDEIASSFNEIDENDPFYKFEKQNPSLENAIEKAKAAVSYPPHGLNTLIYGDTGVGKNFFAEKMWEYAKYIYKKEDINYIYFNCAEYADNPQLLLSQLFGHEKGAFTGANSEKTGLVEKANEGILMLDEIHRLPPTGQELLFNLIDKGTIRRLGGTQEIEINLMIIGATTENPNDSLLKTFTRRFPVIISIPNLVERTLNEKLELIFAFFKQESKRVNMTIWIAGEALKRLVQFKTRNNIGELRNIVSLCCAKSYINYLSHINTSNIKQLHIELFDMPFEVYNSHDSLYSIESTNYSAFFKDGLYIYPDNEETSKFIKNKYYTNLYDFIEERINYYHKLNISETELESKVAFDLDTYYNNVIFNISNNGKDFLLKNGIIENKYSEFVNELLSDASVALGRKFSNSVSMAFALHVQQFAERTRNNKIIYNPNINRLVNTNFIEMEYLNKQNEKLSKKLGINIPNDELGFWSLFLQQGDTEQEDGNQIEIIVLCHGSSTASSIAALANDLMAVDFVHAIDAPINKTFNEIYYEFLNLIKSINSKKGVLCLVDMGSLLVLEEKLQKDTYYKCRCIPNVTSLMVLDAVKVVMSMRDETLDDVFFAVYSKYVNFINGLYVDSLQTNNVPQIITDKCKKTIITICTTGVGGADAIKKYISSTIDCSNIDIINLSILDDIQSIAAKLDDQLLLIVGSINPNISNIPFVSVDRVFTSQGISYIEQIINNQTLKRKTFIDLFNENKNTYDEVLNNIHKFAPSITSFDLSKIAIEFCKRIDETIIKKEKDNSFYVSLILHFICLVDRINAGDVVNSYVSYLDIVETNKDEFFKISNIANDLLNKYNLSVSEADVGDIARIIL